MKKVVVWGTGQEYADMWTVFRYHEIVNNIRIIAYVSKSETAKTLENVSLYNDINYITETYDYILVSSSKYYKEIKSEAMNSGILENVIIPASILKIPGFDFDKYEKLVTSELSIISNNCWGGIIYHSLGLKFKSPFINSRMLPEDFLGIVENLNELIKEPLVRLDESGIPTFLLGDYKIVFPHAKSFSDVEREWDKRKDRINWDNILIEMNTTDIKYAERFNELDYPKKVCFVPFESGLSSCCQIEYNRDKCFSSRIIDLAKGTSYRQYDIFSLLIDGKVKSINC